MTLDATKPNDTTLYSEMDDYQRETREEVNDLASSISGEVVGVQSITSISSESISTGAQMIEVLLIDVDGTLSYLTGADEGHIVYVKLKSGHSLTVSHSGAKTSGDFYLNGVGSNLNMSEYDTLAFVNIGGNASSGIEGYWMELFRDLWA